jgi:hypothetical protein
VLEQTAEMTLYIKQYDRQILELAQSEYPETQVLLKIQGVGHITALTYVLTLGSKERFKRSRGCRLLSRSATPTKPLRRARSATRHQRPAMPICGVSGLTCLRILLFEELRHELLLNLIQLLECRLQSRPVFIGSFAEDVFEVNGCALHEQFCIF